MTVPACTTFTVTITGAPAGTASAVITYDGATQTVAVLGGSATASFTAVGSGSQVVSAIYFSGTGGTGTVTGAETGTVTVTPAPAGTISTTLTTPVSGTTTATTIITCDAGLTSINGTLTYTLPGGGTVTAAVTNGVVGTTDLGVALTPGQVVTVTFTSQAGCPACTLAPITVTVPALSSCSVVIQPLVGPVVVGQPTSVTAVVLCNGLPISGASVTFTSGTATATAVTNALGVATGSLTFSTAGPATVTATVTATGTPCACTGVVSVPITVTVAPQSTCQ
ncbi:hypothetical protein, partial [Kitasatospora aureofaciens]|uniref:hypothetical protein n=1 Tax=Kitasatospora aureofaciens TaxID=1894 RepID=UPI0036F46525